MITSESQWLDVRPPQESADFRPQHFTMSASMIGAALVLCNDRPETFGAPDVLEVPLDNTLSPKQT